MYMLVNYVGDVRHCELKSLAQDHKWPLLGLEPGPLDLKTKHEATAPPPRIYCTQLLTYDFRVLSVL